MWEKVVRNPKLLILVMVIFFLIVFFWDRGFDPEGVFIPPELEPETEFIDHQKSEKFNLDLELVIVEKGEDLYDFQWILEVVPLLEVPELEVYGMLPLEIEEYYDGDEIFPTWLRQEEEEKLLIEEQRLLSFDEGRKNRIAELAGWLKVVFFWEEGEEYLEIKIPPEEINWEMENY